MRSFSAKLDIETNSHEQESNNNFCNSHNERKKNQCVDQRATNSQEFML